MHPAAHGIHLGQLPEVRITGLGFAGRVWGQIGTCCTVYSVASGEEPANTKISIDTELHV